jgi:hypothetical protein
VQSEETCNKEDYDHNADDVKNIHCVHRLRHARLQNEETALRSITLAMEVSSILPDGEADM